MVFTTQIKIPTRGDGDITDITPEVSRALTASGLAQGTVTVFVSGSTAGVTTIEFEPGLEEDFRDVWERLAPQSLTYAHNQRWGDGNGHAHVRAALLGPSLVVPFNNGRLALGTWQQIIFVDFDNRPRERAVLLQFMGE
ncbi:secondary thiamine-phosphate synthase enzyme YjbQ [Chloroflexota bacterium]